MIPTLLQADCDRCAALCCVSLAFDRSETFAFDKAAGVPCPNITPDHRCGVHRDLDRRGFAGCARYDCLGAGQRVAQEIFPGRSWTESDALKVFMMDAFHALREVHELLLLLHTAGRLSLTPEQAGKRRDLLSALQPAGGWSHEDLLAFERGPVPGEVRGFLRSLRDTAARELRDRDSDRERDRERRRLAVVMSCQR